MNPLSPYAFIYYIALPPGECQRLHHDMTASKIDFIPLHTYKDVGVTYWVGSVTNLITCTSSCIPLRITLNNISHLSFECVSRETLHGALVVDHHHVWPVAGLPKNMYLNVQLFERLLIDSPKRAISSIILRRTCIPGTTLSTQPQHAFVLMQSVNEQVKDVPPKSIIKGRYNCEPPALQGSDAKGRRGGRGTCPRALHKAQLHKKLRLAA